MSSAPVIIHGEVSNLPAKRLYLVDAYDRKLVLDSTAYSDGEFVFRYIPPEPFEPRLTSICFYNAHHDRRLLAFKNNQLSIPGKDIGATAFMLEKGTTRISGSVRDVTISTNNLRIDAGRQNDVYFKLDLVEFGAISKKDSSVRSKILERYQSLIRQYPDSYFLLSKIDDYRLRYNNSELEEFLKAFDDELQQSQKADHIRTTMGLRSSQRTTASIIFKDTSGRNSNPISSCAELNVIVFWASWCNPCRKEIPGLKKLHTQLQNKDVCLSSISMDQDIDSWKMAIQQEQMGWPQFIVSKDNFDLVQSVLNFYSIPTIIITDAAGSELYRFSGYEANTIAHLSEWIEHFYSKTSDQTKPN